MNEFVLVDGALARGMLDCQALLRQPGVWAIYEDLGTEAAAVGPILTTTPANMLIDAGTLANASLPARRAWGYAHASLQTSEDAAAVVTHLRRSRYLYTQDGQRFFLRYADARCLLALWAALEEPQRKALLGPVERWTVLSADRKSVSLLASAVNQAVTTPLKLNGRSLETLTRAMWSWSLLGAAEEADEALVEKGSDASALLWCDRATAIANEEPRSGFAVETMLAVALIRSDGRADSDATFHQALHRARQANDAHEIQRWIVEARAMSGAVHP